MFVYLGQAKACLIFKVNVILVSMMNMQPSWKFWAVKDPHSCIKLS